MLHEDCQGRSRSRKESWAHAGSWWPQPRQLLTAPRAPGAATPVWDAHAQKEHPKRGRLSWMAEVGPGHAGGVLLEPLGDGTGGGSPELLFKMFFIPWSPDKSREQKVHWEVATVGEN